MTNKTILSSYLIKIHILQWHLFRSKIFREGVKTYRMQLLNWNEFFRAGKKAPTPYNFWINRNLSVNGKFHYRIVYKESSIKLCMWHKQDPQYDLIHSLLQPLFNDANPSPNQLPWEEFVCASTDVLMCMCTYMYTWLCAGLCVFIGRQKRQVNKQTKRKQAPPQQRPWEIPGNFKKPWFYSWLFIHCFLHLNEVKNGIGHLKPFCI